MAAFPPGTQRAVLRLQAVREEDAGWYVCEALGEAGVTFNGTELDVGCKSLPPLLGFRCCPSQLPLAASQVSCTQLSGFPSVGVSVLSTS